jgi:acetylornithine/N-succinyldiaminopimelate aminotransferase
MHSIRQLFLHHNAQTSGEPLLLEIVSARGVEMFDVNGKSYLDLISGISVSSIGHCHPDVVAAIQLQLEKHMHLMVYGEVVQSVQVSLAKELAAMLPSTLNCCYFTNSGSEAIEGAMKLAKRYTGRHEIIAFNNGYHGSTQGALSIIGSEYFRNSFRPLLPSIRHLDFNVVEQLEQITANTACVIIEPVQGEAGAIVPSPGYLLALRRKCSDTGTLLVFDEIQTGFGRTGPFMSFMDDHVVPDILVVAKAMGGGMPIGAFISSGDILSSFTNNPVLGHITTFGGHPVSCAAALAALNVVKSILPEDIVRKGQLFKEKLVHEKIVNVSGRGLLLAVEFESEEACKKIISLCIENGIFTDWFLFAPQKMRIAPPLIIEDHQIFMACEVILKCINYHYSTAVTNIH